MQPFDQNETSVLERKFYLYITTDGLTPATDQANGQPLISINGGDFANTTNTMNHMGYGIYNVDLTQAEIGVVGKFVIVYPETAGTKQSSDIGVVSIPLIVDLGILRQLLIKLQRTADDILFLVDVIKKKVLKLKELTQ
jgi:hypothetical protein